MPIKSLLLTAAALALSAQAAAQISWTPNFNLAPNLMQQAIIYPVIEKTPETKPDNSRPASPKSSNAVDAKALTYRVSLPRREQNLAGFVHKTRAVDPVGASQMEQLFAETDVIAIMAGGIEPYGLRVDNAADAYTLYWISAWQAANGDDSTPTRTQVSGVKKQAAASLMAAPEFIAADDALKQEMSEAYLLQSLVISQFMDYGKANPRMKPQIAAAVRKGAEAAGFDLDQMVLTATGFENR